MRPLSQFSGTVIVLDEPDGASHPVGAFGIGWPVEGSVKRAGHTVYGQLFFLLPHISRGLLTSVYKTDTVILRPAAKETRTRTRDVARDTLQSRMENVFIDASWGGI